MWHTYTYVSTDEMPCPGCWSHPTSTYPLNRIFQFQAEEPLPTPQEIKTKVSQGCGLAPPLTLGIYFDIPRGFWCIIWWIHCPLFLGRKGWRSGEREHLHACNADIQDGRLRSTWTKHRQNCSTGGGNRPYLILLFMDIDKSMSKVLDTSASC